MTVFSYRNSLDSFTAVTFLVLSPAMRCFSLASMLWFTILEKAQEQLNRKEACVGSGTSETGKGVHQHRLASSFSERW